MGTTSLTTKTCNEKSHQLLLTFPRSPWTSRAWYEKHTANFYSKRFIIFFFKLGSFKYIFMYEEGALEGLHYLKQ